MTHARQRILVLVVVAVLAGIAITVVVLRSRVEMTAAASDGAGTVSLPQPKYDGQVSVEKALLKRRSIRSYLDQPLTLADASQLLWAAQGITDKVRGLRSAPSAGALYPLEVYLVAGKVSDLPSGIYKYVPQSHTLTRVAEGDKRKELAQAALDQSWIAEAPAVLVVSAVYERTTGKYGRRGNRYVEMDAGFASENVHLQAVALGLGSGTVGAFSDDGVKKLMSLPDKEVPLLILPVGKPRG